MAVVNVVMAQINTLVGDIEGNTQKVIECVTDAQQDYCADIVVFPELTLCGYPPEDLLLRASMDIRIERARAILAQQAFSAIVVVGYPQRIGEKQYNMAGVLQGKQWIAEYAKQELPNYQVFDEKRYFDAGVAPVVFDCKGIPTALSVCEDIWHEAPLLQAQTAGAKLLININASPFHQHKQQERHTLLARRAQQGSMAIVYVNQVGGQDELVFDGGSFVVNPDGEHHAQAPLYQEGLFLAQCQFDAAKDQQVTFPSSPHSAVPPVSPLHVISQALVVGLRDYVNKNGCSTAISGLYCGIDSALKLAICVDDVGIISVTEQRLHVL